MASIGANMIWILACILLQHNAAGQTVTPTDSLYPYGPLVGDNTLQTDTNLPINIGYNVNFYGRKYNTTYITKNGFVGFDKNAEYEHFIFKDGARDPNLDFPFLAPFYFDGEGITNEYQGRIYYRLLFTNTSQDFLTQLRYYMLNATVGVEQFYPDVALIVTWENVTDKSQVETGPCLGTTSMPCQSSTFQLVLVACPMNTFVIFNYRKMEIPLKPYYQAGINGGHGVGWTRVCTGCDINNLPNERGSDVTGRFIFRVSEDTIERGGCSLTGRHDLQIYPNVVGMLGGELLDITGPCLDSSVSIVCKFGTDPDQVTSQGFKVNSMRFKCPMPRLTARGSVTVAVSLNGGNTYKADGQIFVVMESQVPRSLILDEAWHGITPGTLQMTWDKDTLSTDPTVMVDIRLVGYRETDVEILWKVLTTLATGVENNGVYSFNPADVQCHPADCDLFEIGVMEVELQKPYHQQANTRVVMNSGVLLGWFVNNAMTSKHGDAWPPAKCTEWYNADRSDTTWLNSLHHCPCNVGQAQADFGRWQPDHGCSMFSTSSTNCKYHIGAKHCVRSFEPTNTGAGNQCCYGEDGLLMYAADTYQGSTPDRSHDWGAQPYNKPGFVPSLSHWIKDVVSFYYCCLWTDYNGCDFYMELRPTRDCAAYQTPQAAIAFGDPHIKTFDGQMYNFGGKGDYYLLKMKKKLSDQFQLQGQFSVGQQNHVNTVFNVTVLTAVAMSELSGTYVEIHLAPKGLNRERGVDVFVDGKIQLFDSPNVFKQDFQGLSVVNNVPDPSNNLHNNFTVIFESGIGVQVAASNNLLHVIVNLPPNLKNKTSGLLGTWNGEVNDEYTSRNGYIVPVTSSQHDVYENFAKTWYVPEVNSLFKHKEPADNSFVPVYTAPALPDGSSFSLPDVQNTCEDDNQCKFDYIVTGNRDIAIASRNAGSWFTQLKSYQQPALACGLLDVPYAQKDNYNYSIDNAVTLTGCRNGGSLSGTTSYTCSRISDGQLAWSPTVTAECSEPAEGANVGMIVGIVVAVIAAIVIAVVIAVVIYKRTHSGDRKTSKKGEPETEEDQKVAMMSELEKKQAEDPEDPEDKP